MDDPIVFIMLAVLGTFYFSSAKAQTVVIQNPAGYTQGYIQQNGSTVNLLTPNGNVAATGTVYPTQITIPTGAAIGVPSYTVPMTPPSPPSPRVLQ